MSFRTRWKVREYVRNSIWIVPALFAIAAIIAGSLFPDLDKHTADEAEIVVELTAETARGVLGALSGGMITFTGFVFSILLLAVQFGSSQFSPRMLRRFLRDRTTKIALGMFIATFIYSLLVLGSIGTHTDPEFVPVTSVTVAVLLLLASMFMFLRLISRTTQSLRVASVLRSLGADACDVIDRVYPDPALDPAAVETDDLEPADREPAVVLAYQGEASVLQSIDAPGLVAMAIKCDAEIELVPPIGSFLIAGEPLFSIRGGPVERRALEHSVAVGDERTMRQDPAFAFRLLADISSKALSPGVNDPSTATQALDQIEVLLRQLAQRRLTPGVLRDPDNRVRLRYPAPSWEDYVSLALDETRQYGEGSVQVARRLKALLQSLIRAVPPYRRAAVDAQLALMGSSIQRAFSDEVDRDTAGKEDRQGIGTPTLGAKAAVSG